MHVTGSYRAGFRLDSSGGSSLRRTVATATSADGSDMTVLSVRYGLQANRLAQLGDEVARGAYSVPDREVGRDIVHEMLVSEAWT